MVTAFGTYALNCRRAVIANAPLIGVCLIPILLYLPVIVSPFERDEGVYATIAQRLIHGDLPYRDLFDNKPPVVFGWYALSFLLFGENVAAPRIVAAALLSLTTLAVFGQARTLFPQRLAYLVAIAFALATGLPFVALHANTEAYMLLPLVGALGAFNIGMRRERLAWFVLAGVFGGVAIMTKQVAVWNLLALAIAAVVMRWRSGQTVWERVAPSLSLVLGATVAIVLIAAPFVMTGALGELVYANVSYNWAYAGFLSLGEELTHLALGATLMMALAAPLVAGAGLGLWTVARKRSRPIDWVLVVWCVASALGVASGGRFFPHYFLQLIPAMVLLTGTFVYSRFGAGVSPWKWKWNPVLVVGALLISSSLAANAMLYLAPVRTEQAVAENVIYQEEWDQASQRLGAYISERTSPRDTIFDLGRESQIYFYADRRPAAPYFYDYVYDYDEAALAQTLEALRLAKPVYIVDSIKPPLFEPSENRPPEMDAFLAQNYEYEGRIFFADLYRLRADR